MRDSLVYKLNITLRLHVVSDSSLEVDNRNPDNIGFSYLQPFVFLHTNFCAVGILHFIEIPTAVRT